MNYFCRTTIEAAKDKIRTFFMMVEADPKSNTPPSLKKEVLLEQHEYKEFLLLYHPKATIMVDYILYQTEENVHAATQPEIFEDLIQSGKATILSSGELQIEPTDKKDKGGVVRRKKKSSPLLVLGIVSGVAIIALISFQGGKMLGLSHKGNADTESNPGIIAEDGMIIPVQNVIADDAEQITVSIDRSYAAVPTEDLQLKGTVGADGSAQITLPEFDKTDFFTHVSGYTWGFTTDPDGTEI